MQFKDIFAEYYTLFRGDSDIPTTTDTEWSIAVRYGNTAIRRFENVDGEMWNFLWTTAAKEGNSYSYSNTSSVPVITTITCPDNMKMPGGWIKFTDPVSKAFFMIDVIQPYEVQLKSGNDPYAYFTGDENNGFTLNISLAGNSYQGYIIDFPYYKKPTYFDATVNATDGVNEDGTTVTECPDANYIINYILAYRLRSTRNYPSYQTAKNDAETALEGMQIKNRIGQDGNEWNSMSKSTGSFGAGVTGFARMTGNG